MNRTLISVLAILLATSCSTQESKSLKDAFEGKFLIGTALNETQIKQLDSRADSLITLHFNAIEPENCLKSCEIMPVFGQYQWELADKYVDFGTSKGLAVFGHCLIWHSQCTPDFCYDADGKLLDPETLKERMKQHIYTTMGRYKGRIKGWDVVNEAIIEDGSYRESPFYQILGKEYIPWAFKCAQEADPECELYINDYSMHEPAKVDAYIRIANDLIASGIRIDAIGFQGHIGMDYPDPDVYEGLIKRVKAETGLDVCITELDMSIQPTLVQSADLGEMSSAEVMKVLNPYKDGIPQEIYDEWNRRMTTFFDIFIRNSSIIRRINVWGLCDKDSWKNG